MGRNAGRALGHHPANVGKALVANKKPARTMSPIIRDFVDVMDATNLSGRALSKKTGVHWVTLSNWKHGVHSPSLVDFEVVASALGYKLELTPMETTND